MLECKPSPEALPPAVLSSPSSYVYDSLCLPPPCHLSPQEALPAPSLLSSRPSLTQPEEARQAGLEQGTEQMALAQATELPGLALEPGRRCFQTPMMFPSPPALQQGACPCGGCERNCQNSTLASRLQTYIMKPATPTLCQSLGCISKHRATKNPQPEHSWSFTALGS